MIKRCFQQLLPAWLKGSSGRSQGSGVDSASTADAVDTVDSTEDAADAQTNAKCLHPQHTLIADGNHNCCKDAMGPEMSKLETGKSSSCIACVGPGDGTGKA